MKNHLEKPNKTEKPLYICVCSQWFFGEIVTCDVTARVCLYLFPPCVLLSLLHSWLRPRSMRPCLCSLSGRVGKTDCVHYKDRVYYDHEAYPKWLHRQWSIPKVPESNPLTTLLICSANKTPVLLLLLKKVGSARLRESGIHPISPKTSASQHQPIDRKKRKGKKVEDCSRDRAA